MVTMYRKNRKWKAISISIDIDMLNDLEQVVGLEVRNSLSEKDKKNKWLAIDIVDTLKISTDVNPINGKSTLNLLIYVADMTGVQL